MLPGNPDDDLESPAPPQSMAGQRFGPYQIVREIGRGGMGAVYLAARADDQFKQQVALKILRGGFNLEEVLRRFRAERQILATLNHPNICRLLDGGSTPSGEPYLVMDFIEGVSMDQFCNSRHYSIIQRIELFRQVCSAVQYVHQNLIVHRDLKPSNILVTDAGVAKLLDFGIAKILKSDAVLGAEPTRTEAQVMTLAYASPEQIRGEPITTASDVYSLGVILYELLTGQRPYRLKTTSPHELPRAIVEVEPTRPSTAVLQTDDKTAHQSLQRSLKGDLDNILLKSLRKEPDRRYPSVELFSEDLRCHLKNLPVTAHQDSFGYRAGKFIRRHKAPVIAAAIAVISLIAVLITTVIETRIARSERALAESRFQDVRKLATTFLFEVHDSIQNLPGSTPARSLIARTGTEYLDRLARQARQEDTSLQQELARGYLKVGDVEGDPYGANLGDTAKALESYRKGLFIAQALVARDPRDRKSQGVLAWAHFQLAGVLAFANQKSMAFEQSTAALKIYQHLLATDSANIEASLDLGRAYERQGDLLGGAQGINLGRKEEAAAAYQRALDLIPELPKDHTFAARAARGRVLIGMKLAGLQGNRTGPEILSRYQESLRIAEAASRDNPNDSRARELVGYVLNRIAGTQQSFGDLPGALESYRRAAAIHEAGIQADPNNANERQNTMGFYKNFGDLYFYSLKNWAEALKCYRRAGELMESEIHSDPGNVVVRQRYSEVLTCIGSCLLRLSQPQEARVQSKRGLDMARELADRPNSSRDHKYNYAWLAVTVEPDDLQEAQRALPYALKAVELDQGKDEYSLHVLAQAYTGISDYPHCVENEQKGLALFPAVAPGAPKPGMQQTMELMLQYCQQRLK